MVDKCLRTRFFPGSGILPAAPQRSLRSVAKHQGAQTSPPSAASAIRRSSESRHAWAASNVAGPTEGGLHNLLPRRINSFDLAKRALKVGANDVEYSLLDHSSNSTACFIQGRPLISDIVDSESGAEILISAIAISLESPSPTCMREISMFSLARIPPRAPTTPGALS